MQLLAQSMPFPQLLLLAPSESPIPEAFQNVIADSRLYGSILAGMQQMRGQIYLEDGAIEERQLARDGRHRLPVDDASWHLLTFNRSGSVTGCVRVHVHKNTASFDDLGLRTSALAQSQQWGKSLQVAVESELATARRMKLSYVEVGGWAIAKERRCTSEALTTMLATYSLAQLLGGCLGVATATVRNGSAGILRRFGGRSLEIEGRELPSYYDRQYKCHMEVLRFASSSLNPRYGGWVRRIRAALLDVPVVFGWCQRTSAGQWGVIPPQLSFMERSLSGGTSF